MRHRLQRIYFRTWKPVSLNENKNLCFRGIEIRGDGFILSKDEVSFLISKNPNNKDVIRRFLTGTELNTRWSLLPEIYVINFGDKNYDESCFYSECMNIVIQRVKPSRDAITKQIHEPCFWKFWDKRNKQFEELSGLPSFLVKTRDSMEWAFAYVSSELVISSKVIIFKDPSKWRFACLQSSLHRVWCENGGSTIGRALTYNPTMGLEQFPFPMLEITQPLEEYANRYLEVRKQLMLISQIGLNGTYQQTHNQGLQSKELCAFRDAIIMLDNAVLNAYGWSDLLLSHGFHEVSNLPENDRVRFTISESARAEVISRLCELNRQRFEEEAERGLHGEASRTQTPSRPANPLPSQLSSLDFGDAFSSQPAISQLSTSLVTSGVEKYEKVILDFLTSHLDWHTKSDVITATKVPDSHWNKAITLLVSRGLVERRGERRGAKYRCVSQGPGAR